MKYGLYTKGKNEALSIIIKSSYKEAKEYFVQIKRFTEEQFDNLFDVKEIKEK
jgi:hypothetical protein